RPAGRVTRVTSNSLDWPRCARLPKSISLRIPDGRSYAMEEIGIILPKVLKPQLSRLEPPVVEVLAPLWTRVAGKALAGQCRPVAFSAGTLTLATDNADWAEPLQQMAGEIRAAVNNFLGKPVVKHLRILRARKFDRSDRTQRQPEDLPVSRPDRK